MGYNTHNIKVLTLVLQWIEGKGEEDHWMLGFLGVALGSKWNNRWDLKDGKGRLGSSFHPWYCTWNFIYIVALIFVLPL